MKYVCVVLSYLGIDPLADNDDNDGSYDDVALARSPPYLILLTQYPFIDPTLIYLSPQLGGDRTQAAREGELDGV